MPSNVLAKALLRLGVEVVDKLGGPSWEADSVLDRRVAGSMTFSSIGDVVLDVVRRLTWHLGFLDQSL